MKLGEKGYTYIELIVAITIAALVAVFIARSNWLGSLPSYWGVWLFIGLAIAAVILEGAVPVEDAADMDAVSA